MTKMNIKILIYKGDNQKWPWFYTSKDRYINIINFFTQHTHIENITEREYEIYEI